MPPATLVGIDDLSKRADLFFQPVGKDFRRVDCARGLPDAKAVVIVSGTVPKPARLVRRFSQTAT